MAKDHRDDDLLNDSVRLNNELANLQRSLAKTNLELERLNKQKNRFLGMAAHDLRNPLTAIQMCSEYLLEESGHKLNPDELEFLAAIRSSSEFMLRLVNDLLDVAIIESGKLQLDLWPTDLKPLLSRSVMLNGILAKRKGIELRLSEYPEVPKLAVDPSKIEQVINNLLSNAVNYSKPNTTVDIRLELSESELVISVKDEGPGIPGNELDKLFRPFERTTVRTSNGEKSSGLGLAIARKIVLGHRGRIWLESEVGKGSVFYVALPIPEE
jgi:signal transduction histidine kinase